MESYPRSKIIKDANAILETCFNQKKGKLPDSWDFESWEEFEHFNSGRLTANLLKKIFRLSDSATRNSLATMTGYANLSA